MSQVFISYRQTSSKQRKRVRAFAERLRKSDINVVLDQFFLDENPAGPDQGWPKWSSDQALRSDYVLIVGTQDWFQCFDGTQPPGFGLGAACEANDIRTRIYESAGVIKSIRVVLFNDADEACISGTLRPYHRFHAKRDLANMLRWLRPTVNTDTTPRTSIPHNLPSLQPFFGRQDELRRVAEALDPESRTWGALINGPGGIGKTSLAVRAAYDAPPEAFEKIAFVSLKSRELDDEGVRDLSDFLISGLAELFNDLARELGHADIAKAPEGQRLRRLLDVLRGTRTLLVLDNLESLLKHERDIVFTFVKKLPPGCKAILTSRIRIGSAADELILEGLSKHAALSTLAKIAESNPALAKTSEAERLDLYKETGGKPLLLRWVAGQIGRRSCLTLSDAIIYLRLCPKGNDPLEFIFGDLIEGFTETEIHVLSALTYFTESAKVQYISQVADCLEADTNIALRRLVNYSLVVPSEELETFALVPLVADFLRRKKPEVVVATGDRLKKYAYALVVENGYQNHERFHVLDAAWPIVAAALPLFLAGQNDELQEVCNAVFQPCNYSGRYDESIALSKDAEVRAVSAGDFSNAGWRAYHVGWIHYLRQQSAEVLACADRVEEHWRQTEKGIRENAVFLHLRGLGYMLGHDYASAIDTYREAVELWRSLDSESKDVAIDLNALAEAERLSGDTAAADRDEREALRIARAVDYREGIATYTGNLAAAALNRRDWLTAEDLAREALAESERIGSLGLTASNCQRLARALARQGKKTAALPYAQRAVEILARLRSPDLPIAHRLLTDCQS